MLANDTGVTASAGADAGSFGKQLHSGRKLSVIKVIFHLADVGFLNIVCIAGGIKGFIRNYSNLTFRFIIGIL